MVLLFALITCKLIMEVLNPCPGNLPGQTNAIFMNFVNTFMATQCVLNQMDKYPEDIAPILLNDDKFDFIVVGGGTAGSIVASRLSEIESFRVLLLESGGVPSAATKVSKFFLCKQIFLFFRK